MSKSRSIPGELIKVKAYKIWKERQLSGRQGTPESDWEEAVDYLENHRWAIFLWKINTPVRSLRNFWSLFGEPQSRDFALEVIKTLGIGLTAFGLLFSVWEGIEDRKETRENRILTQKQLDTAQERLITDRFSKAVEQLGKDKITVRIGAIYALERIAKDSPKDHWTIMEVLISYVREDSSLPPKLKQYLNNEQQLEPRQKELEKLTGVSIDVQAALTVIGRRKDPKPDRSEKIDLSFTNLFKAVLGKANLQQAKLYGASLQQAKLWSASLQRADLWSANLQQADLYGASLQQANLGSANLQQANLGSANLQQAFLAKVKDLTPKQIKSACFWDKAIYIGEWYLGKGPANPTEPDNTNFIKDLKKDFSSDPKKPPDCSIWKS